MPNGRGGFFNFYALYAPWHFLYFFNAEVTTNLLREEFANFIMTRDCGWPPRQRIKKYTVPSAFSNKDAALLQKMLDELPPFH